jgi:hypothetical protein
MVTPFNSADTPELYFDFAIHIPYSTPADGDGLYKWFERVYRLAEWFIRPACNNERQEL